MPARSRRDSEVAVVRAAQPRSTHGAVAGATERRLPGAMEVPIEQVAPDESQPRQDWEAAETQQRLDELAESIREFGILQPILVREADTLDDGRQRYLIIAGARRREAAARAGLATLPVVIRGEEAARIRVLQLIENLQRQSLNKLDEGRAFQELMDVEELTPPQLAQRLHISAQHVRDRLRVLADQVLADAVQRGQIPMTAARDIKKLPDEAALHFRARILAGERLRINDVEVVRANLAAAGIINPRRKVAQEKQTTFVPAHGAAMDDAATTPAISTDTSSAGQPNLPTHTSLTRAPNPVADGQAEQTSFVFPAGALGASAEADRTARADGTEQQAGDAHDDESERWHTAADRVAMALDAGLRGQRRAEVASTLRQMADVPDLAQWWWLVYARLSERLDMSD